MIDSNLIQWLRGLGTAAGDRVHAAVLPQQTQYPAVAVTRISGSIERDLSGEEIGRRAQFRIDVYGSRYDDLSPAQVIRDALDGFRGVMGTTRVFFAQIDSFQDVSEEDGDRKIRHLVHDVSFTYTED